jgi:hypothetical protein
MFHFYRLSFLESYQLDNFSSASISEKTYEFRMNLLTNPSYNVQRIL